MQNFRNLKAWQNSHQLVMKIYSYTHNFPKDEIYGLRSQIRRSSVSISSNIAEGCRRGSDSDFARFIQIAIGSASELEYQVFLAYELNYFTATEYQELNETIEIIKKMLTTLKKKLNQSCK